MDRARTSDNTSGHNLIRRGYDLACYEMAMNLKGALVVTHLIFGLPGESHEDILDSVRFAANTDTWG